MKVIIIGGGYAGIACATRLARRARAESVTADITLVNPTEHFIERIRLHQQGVGQALKHRSIKPLLDRAGVKQLVGSAHAIDIKARTVYVGDQKLAWDRLVLAMGSRSGESDPEKHKYCLEAGDSEALAKRLQSLPESSNVVVVGGGLTGIEAATEIRESHPMHRVTLVSRGLLAQGWSQQARQHVLQCFKGMGIELLEGVNVLSVDSGDMQTTLGKRAFDVCVWTAGFEFSGLPREAGLAVNSAGQVQVDPQLRSISHPEVYVAGDISVPVQDPGLPMPMGCKSALPTGTHVAENLFRELTDKPLSAFDFATPFYCVSLGRRDGLVQWPDAHGQMRGKIYKGRAAAWFKEFVCRSTWWCLNRESRGKTGIVWKRTGKAPESLGVKDMQTQST